MLTDVACRRAACAPGKPYTRFADAGGLYLEVSAAGGKSWRWKYRVRDGAAGKLVERRLTIGRYPDVGVADARAARDRARLALREGVDPALGKRAPAAVAVVDPDRTFEAVARAWWAKWRRNRSTKYADQVLARFEVDYFPQIGVRDVGTLLVSDFVACAERVDDRGAGEAARRSYQNCGAVMRYAAARFPGVHDVTADAKPRDIFVERVERHHPAVAQHELPGLLRAIDAYPGAMLSRVAMQLLALTFVRTQELLGARAGEVDFEAALWTVPGDRMKVKGEPHAVPLAPQALALFRLLIDRAASVRPVTDDTLLFPNRADSTRMISRNVVRKALEVIGYKDAMTGHGFRSVASTALNEMRFRGEVIEAQLAHVERDQTRAAYNHARYLDERREMMMAWANHLDDLRRLPVAAVVARV